MTAFPDPARSPSRVVVVDDSAAMRELLTALLDEDPALEVVATARDPYEAWSHIRRLRPDVVTLDVEMPRMDGITFLRKLMKALPTPVVMISSLTEASCDTTFRALELGAVEIITKPKVDIVSGLSGMGDDIRRTVRAAAAADVGSHLSRRSADRRRGSEGQPRRRGQDGGWRLRTTDQVIAIGASTGGTVAIEEILTRLPGDAPGMVIVQHMPAGFTRAFAERLDGQVAMRVREAVDGDVVRPGLALIAPGDHHLRLRRSGARYLVDIGSDAPVSGHRPAVDVLFASAAEACGGNAVGVLLTGMGKDGVQGMRAMREAGAHTIAEHESTCVVFGMPRAAIDAGAAASVLPRQEIAHSLLRSAAATPS